MGLTLFLVGALYVVAIVVCDSIVHRRFVMSKNLLRHMLDGVTLATGCTVAYAVWDPSYITTVASSGIYVTTTSLTCIVGPLMGLAERYGHTIEA